MRNAMAPIFLVLFLAGTPVRAAESAKPARAPVPGSSVEMPYLIAPMTSEEGRLTGYAYISIKLIAASPDGAVRLREKTPFIQDAFVRDVNARDIGLAGNPARVDQEGLKARLLSDARRIAGAGTVVSLEILQIQTSSLRSSPQG